MPFAFGAHREILINGFYWAEKEKIGEKKKNPKPEFGDKWNSDKLNIDGKGWVYGNRENGENRGERDFWILSILFFLLYEIPT